MQVKGIAKMVQFSAQSMLVQSTKAQVFSGSSMWRTLRRPFHDFKGFYNVIDGRITLDGVDGCGQISALPAQ